MAQPRPSLTLILDIDERLDNEDLHLEVNRSYTHVAPTLVRTHAPATEEEPIVNTVRLLVKMGSHAYLHSADEEADDLWDSVIAPWLHNEFHKVANNMKIFNRRQREIGNDELDFHWLEVDLQNGALCVLLHLDSVSDIDPNRSVLLTELRSLLNDGKLGEGVERVFMPSPAAYELQRAAGLVVKEQRDADAVTARNAREAEEQAARQREEERAEDEFLESPSLVEESREDADEESFSLQNDPETRFAFPEPDFPIVFHPWLIEYAGDQKRVFDPKAGLLS